MGIMPCQAHVIEWLNLCMGGTSYLLLEQIDLGLNEAGETGL